MNESPFAFALAAFLVMICSCAGADAPFVDEWETDSEITATFSKSEYHIYAGQAVRIEIDTEQSIACVLHCSNAMEEFVVLPAESSIPMVFQLDSSRTTRTGMVLLSLFSFGHLLAQSSLLISALPADGLIPLYTGPNTVEAGSDQQVMTIAIPKDPFGNPVSKESEVVFWQAYGGETLQSVDLMRNLHSYQLFRPGTVADKSYLAVSCNQAHAKEQEFRIEASWPAELQINVEEIFPFSDSRQNVLLSTELTRDRFGNLVADGTAIWFILERNSHFYGKFLAYTVNGIAKVRLQNPRVPCSLQVFAVAENAIRSNSLDLHFEAAVSDIPTLYYADSSKLQIGPVSAPLGQILPDGYPVFLEFSGVDFSYEKEGELFGGYYAFYLPEFVFTRSGLYSCSITIGGKVEQIKIDVD